MAENRQADETNHTNSDNAPQAQPSSPAPAVPPAQVHVIKIAPDERLNLAYNMHYTHMMDVREEFLQELAQQSQRGGRGHCSRCERTAVRFVLLKTQFGPYILAVCEQCGAWYLM